MRTGHLYEGMTECITNCDECSRECAHLVGHCLSFGGAWADASHIRLLLDCAGICRTAAEFMARASPLHGVVCQACAHVCDRCGADCETFDDDDEMLACAAVCRRCADSCREMTAGSA